jgi:MinD superfamily P-loop ATPase
VILEKNYLFFPELCHSCGTCKLVCPQDAITEDKRTIGKIDIGYSINTQFVSGILNEGEVKAPPLIEQVKDKINPDLINIVDCSPGSSCPAIEGIKNSDYVVMVTEPTPFGLHDLKIAADMVRILDIPFGVVINKSGLGNNEVYKFCDKENIPIIMEIPFKKEFAKECSKGNILANIFPEMKNNFLNTYKKISNQLFGGDIS